MSPGGGVMGKIRATDDRPLYGFVTGDFLVEPYPVSTVAETIKGGAFTGCSSEIRSWFGREEVGLAQDAMLSVVRFNRRPTSFDEIAVWAQARRQIPMLLKHLLGLGVSYRRLSLQKRIVAPGVSREGRLLYISENHARWAVQDVSLGKINVSDYLFGFVSS